MEVINEIRIIRPGIKAVAVLSQTDAKGSDVEDVRRLFTEDEAVAGCLTFVDAGVGNRKAFANAASDGLAVVEYRPRDAKAVEEINRFFRAVTGLEPVLKIR